MQSVRRGRARTDRPEDAGGTLETAAMDGLRRIVQQLRRSTTRTERALGLTGAQLFVLQQLRGGEGLSIRALASRTRTDPSSVSVVVAQLVERGLVERRADPADRRRAALALSARGERLVRRTQPPAQALLLQALGELPRAELARLSRTLATLARRMGSPEAPAAMFFEDAHQRRRERRVR
jgi:DNA-binding MarR family transcriptional regulator